MLNPCCCLSPRIGVFIFGIIDMLIAVSSTLGVLDFIFQRGLNGESIVALAINVVMIIMALFLILGAWKQAADKIRLWLIVWIVLIIVSLVFQVFSISSHHVFGIRQGGPLIGLLLMIYQIWVVYAYLVELRSGPAGLTYCPSRITV